MKHRSVLFLMLALTPLATLVNADSWAAGSRNFVEQKRYIRVNADAEIRVKPDRVSITFGISQRSSDLKAAKERMSQIIRDAIAFCKANGIQEKNIQTAHIGITPVYRWEQENDRSTKTVLLTHYELAQNFSVTMEDLKKYDDIIFALLDKGINTVENVSFSTTELRKHRDNARVAAVKAAYEKAKLLTNAAGIKLGKAVSVEENNHRSFFYRPSLNRMNVSQNAFQASAEGNQDMEGEGLAPGMISITAGVTVEYELETP